MFRRSIEAVLLEAVRSFPAVVLTGARQTGKTTLCRQLFDPTHRYVSLEDPDRRRLALADPRSFLESHPGPVILDEIQYAPELLSYLQGMIDADRGVMGRYLLTGSQNFLLMERVAQSLAGRAAVLSLHPLSVAEVDGAEAPSRGTLESVADWILRGGYPELRFRPDLNRELWIGSYVRLYLERDVRQAVNISDLDSFERFLRLLAARTGCLLNYSDLARDAGISHSTARRWLSVLQASYQVVLLPPFHANISKRLVKCPRLYFTDTGIASYLMGLHDREHLVNGPAWGALFETACVMELLKHQQRLPAPPVNSFFRTGSGLEVDVIIERGVELEAVEIKGSRTPSPHWADSLREFKRLFPRTSRLAVQAIVDTPSRLVSGIELRPWHRWQGM